MLIYIYIYIYMFIYIHICLKMSAAFNRVPGGRPEAAGARESRTVYYSVIYDMI